MAKKKLSNSELLGELEELFENEHGGCDQNTCDMSVAFNEGYTALAIDLFSGAGVASEKFAELFNQLDRKTFKALVNKEAESFNDEVPHVQCLKCNAVIRNPEDVDYMCDNCGNCALEVIRINPGCDINTVEGQLYGLIGFKEELGLNIEIKDTDLKGDLIEVYYVVQYGEDQTDVEDRILDLVKKEFKIPKARLAS